MTAVVSANSISSGASRRRVRKASTDIARSTEWVRSVAEALLWMMRTGILGCSALLDCFVVLRKASGPDLRLLAVLEIRGLSSLHAPDGCAFCRSGVSSSALPHAAMPIAANAAYLPAYRRA